MDNLIPPEEIRALRDFKIRLFDLFWEQFGTFYLHAMPHPKLDVGKRGLIGEEKESGIVLVFGPRATREIKSHPDYLYAELQFGYSWEQITIPWDSVFRLYDKTQHSVSQLRVLSGDLPFDSVPISDSEKKGKPENPAPKKTKGQTDDGTNVIRVNFGGKPSDSEA